MSLEVYWDVERLSKLVFHGLDNVAFVSGLVFGVLERSPWYKAGWVSIMWYGVQERYSDKDSQMNAYVRLDLK